MQNRKNRQGNAYTGTAVCHNVHDGGAGKLHYQYLHGNLAERLTVFVHFFMLCAVCLKDFQLL